MIGILVGGLIGVLYGGCLNYNLKYAEKRQREIKEREELRKRESLKRSSLDYSRYNQELEERQEQKAPIIVIKDSRVYLVKGGNHGPDDGD